MPSPPSLVPCAVEGCPKVKHTRGWCRTHYSRYLRTGDPGPAELFRPEAYPPGAVCSANNCTSKIKGHGYCNKHMERWQKYGDPLAGQRAFRSPDGELQRFFTENLVRETNDCILWPFPSTTRGGYGLLTWQGKVRAVHVLACEYRHGPKTLPYLQAAHSCHTPACFNPRHLSWKTPKENTADRWGNGTMATGEAHPNSVLTAEQVREVRRRHYEGKEKQTHLAREFGISQSSMNKIITGKTWKHLA